MPVVEQLVRQNVSIYWIDHHPWEKGLLERLEQFCERIEYNEALNTPAAVLLGRWLQVEDPYYTKVSNICYCGEKGSEWERGWFRLLTSYKGKAVKGALARLAYDLELNPEDIQRIDEQIELEKLAEEILAQDIKVVTTVGGKQMAIYDLSDKPGVYLGKKVYQYHKVDFCLMRISPRKWQLSCAPVRRLLPASLIGDYEVAEALIAVRGRPGELFSVELVSGLPQDSLNEGVIRLLEMKL